jgi:hypothetical protein
MGGRVNSGFKVFSPLRVTLLTCSQVLKVIKNSAKNDLSTAVHCFYKERPRLLPLGENIIVVFHVQGRLGGGHAIYVHPGCQLWPPSPPNIGQVLAFSKSKGRNQTF